MKEQGLAGQLRPSSPRAALLPIWLACAVFYYPLFWLASSLLGSAAALTRVAALGHELDFLQLTFLGMRASAISPGGVAGSGASLAGIPTAAWVAGLLAVLILGILGRRHPLASGLAIAALAEVMLTRPLGRLIRDAPLSAGKVAASLLFFAILCFALRRMLAAWVPLRYWGRAASLAAAVALPPALIVVAWRLGGSFWISRQTLLLVAPGIVAAFIVSLKPPRMAPRATAQERWRAVAWGIVACLVLTIGVRQADAALGRARAAATRQAMAAYPDIPANLPFPKLFFQKGVNLTAQWPAVYGSARARQMLERLPDYGVDAVALIPYGWGSPDEPVVRLNPGRNSWESDEGLEQLSRVAHARGLKVMLKPGIWLGYGAYGGDLDFPTPGERAKWFAQYRTFLEHYARLATRIHADVFCVGGEFVKLTKHEDEWRKLIARARELYPGPLIYAANWGSEFEAIAFWDDLDYIGLQNYYPLPDGLSTDAIVPKVEAVQRKFGKPVVFTEVGFASVEGAHREPWDGSQGRPLAPDLQARCYEAIFRAFYDKPWFQGMYWWSIESDGAGGRENGSFTPWGKPAMTVLKRWYAEEGRTVTSDQ